MSFPLFGWPTHKNRPSCTQNVDVLYLQAQIVSLIRVVPVSTLRKFDGLHDHMHIDSAGPSVLSLIQSSSKPESKLRLFRRFRKGACKELAHLYTSTITGSKRHHFEMMLRFSAIACPREDVTSYIRGLGKGAEVLACRKAIGYSDLWDFFVETWVCRKLSSVSVNELGRIPYQTSSLIKSNQSWAKLTSFRTAVVDHEYECMEAKASLGHGGTMAGYTKCRELLCRRKKSSFGLLV